ncbi:phosphonate ABC transporter ATP-binding protein [Tissierella praeacuta]|uniref:Phosphonate transport system ATP-binding protein n=1 Tax=Tissierella praeacuta DSM 18095 TaxID=1123404 RepID=A0A1M4T9V2_9FIRM|nr:phosphonate ABC transporter ATP-binding protein [Tissierella praeacuta]MBU5257186.1 phosphonate ABC transporter ATP-binding protein [Tissierella praeacuta]SHE41263.1 phosphonate transport system ATP-binding protein [Tissierella praeacuta DSM 18095]SUP04817.1 Methionine import ATP-binding protein MetN [Tissierella praeacuta]
MLKLENVTVSYDGNILALENANVEVEQGEFVGIIGSSGSGKSTMLKTINLLVRPINGKIYIDNVDITKLNNYDLRSMRRGIGFIFQDYNLIDRSSVLDNVLMGRLGYKSSFKSIFGIFNEEDYERANRALNQVGLSEKIFERADQLSGGQKQRVAIAKTLCQRPKIILADEPVASLDISSSQTIMNYFKTINEKKNITILINLHDVNLAKRYCNRIIALKKGKILFDGRAGDLDDKILKGIYD